MIGSLSQISTLDPWLSRSAFYEERLASRSHENDRSYQQLVRQYYSFLVPSVANTLEVGCGLGDLLEAVGPFRGVGIDFSAKTIAVAKQRHPDLEFYVG